MFSNIFFLLQRLPAASKRFFIQGTLFGRSAARHIVKYFLANEKYIFMKGVRKKRRNKQ